MEKLKTFALGALVATRCAQNPHPEVDGLSQKFNQALTQCPQGADGSPEPGSNPQGSISCYANASGQVDSIQWSTSQENGMACIYKTPSGIARGGTPGACGQILQYTHPRQKP